MKPMPSRSASKTYGTVSADEQKEMSGASAETARNTGTISPASDSRRDVSALLPLAMLAPDIIDAIAAAGSRPN
jgi:hypothetical protein